MTAFSTSVIPVFMTKLGAQFYAWRARRRGFQTYIQDYGKGSWWELGGRYGIVLTKGKE